jgi:hypothetical protein
MRRVAFARNHKITPLGSINHKAAAAVLQHHDARAVDFAKAAYGPRTYGNSQAEALAKFMQQLRAGSAGEIRHIVGLRARRPEQRGQPRQIRERVAPRAGESFRKPRGQ